MVFILFCRGNIVVFEYLSFLPCFQNETLLQILFRCPSYLSKNIIIIPLGKSGGYTGFALSFCHSVILSFFSPALKKFGAILDLPCHSVTLWFCHSVTFQMKFFITLSGTVKPRRLKLGMHVDSGQYRVCWNQAAPAYSSLYFIIFLSLQFSKPVDNYNIML